MRSVRTVLFVVLSFVLVGLVVTGCETGRVNKRHAHFEAVSDIATTPEK